MLSGDIDTALRAVDKQLLDLWEYIGKRLGNIGNLHCDAIATEERLSCYRYLSAFWWH
jgi:hypothetical protein